MSQSVVLQSVAECGDAVVDAKGVRYQFNFRTNQRSCVLQCVAVCRSLLHYVAECCVAMVNAKGVCYWFNFRSKQRSGVLQCMAVFIVVCCSMWQSVVLQYVAECRVVMGAVKCIYIHMCT